MRTALLASYKHESTYWVARKLSQLLEIYLLVLLREITGNSGVSWVQYTYGASGCARSDVVGEGGRWEGGDSSDVNTHALRFFSAKFEKGYCVGYAGKQGGRSHFVHIHTFLVQKEQLASQCKLCLQKINYIHDTGKHWYFSSAQKSHRSLRP